MSAPVTEAHKQLAYAILFAYEDGPAGPNEAAQLIADSEAAAILKETGYLKAMVQDGTNAMKERDQLRAEVDAQCLLNAKGSEREAVLLGRVDRMAKERLNLRADLDAIKAIRDEETARAERAEAELAGIRALANRRNKRDHSQDTTHQLVAALDQALDIAQAELAATKSTLDEEVNCAEKAEHEVVRQYARAERAEAELALLKPKFERHCWQYNDKLAELRYAENMQRQAESELAKERARLDWLDQRGYLVDKITHGASTPHPEDYWICTDGYSSGSAKTVRDAIDAAMKEGTK